MWNLSEYLLNCSGTMPSQSKNYQNEKLEFSCQVVTTPTLKYDTEGVFPGLDSLSFNLVFTQGQELCETARQVEERWELSCTDLCFKGGGDVLSEDEVLNWINYCQYCSGARNRSEYFLRRNEGRCLASNDTLNEMVNSFPDSSMYCGFKSPGIPIISPFKEFSYICYCYDYNVVFTHCPDLPVLETINQTTKIIQFIVYPILTCYPL